jgi:hypothetical protein
MSFRPKGEILKYLKSQRFLVACAPRNDKVAAFFKGLEEQWEMRF